MFSLLASILPALTSGALGVGEYFLNSASSKKAAKKAYKYNRRLQQYQYEYNTALQKQQNEYNTVFQEDAQAFSREMLGLQQDYATRMSNTSHQREVQDLRAAGLNPILSATGGNGASAPVVSAPSVSAGSVSAPSVSAPSSGISPVIPSGISNSVASAFKIAKEFQHLFEIEKEQLKANVAKSKADVRNQSKVADARARLLDAQARTTGYRTKLGNVPLNFVDEVRYYGRRAIDGYLKYVGKPFSAAVDSFYNHMHNSANRSGRGRDGSFKIEYDPKAENFIYRGNYKGWKR